MAADEFSWPVYAPASGQTIYRTRVAQFGDGYSQEVADGINNKVDTWNVSITDVYPDELQPIIDFLDSKAGYVSFTWTPPGSTTQIRVRCKQHTKTPSGANLVTWSGTFQQVFSF